MVSSIADFGWETSSAREDSWSGAEDAYDLDPRFPVLTDSRREVTTLSKHSRKPRRQSRLVLGLRTVLVLLEIAAAIASLLGGLW